jgi:energy-coupling factor transport system ATP-binding protein
MLDPSGRKEVMEVVTRLNREEGITIVHITHFMEETVNCDRVIVMEKGKKIMDGKPHEIFSQVETLKSISLDVPQVTLLAHELNKANINISREIISIDEMVEELCRLL